MAGINKRKCCCCTCGFPITKQPRVTITGYTPACCPSFIRPSALYGTWFLSQLITTTTIPCDYQFFRSGTWPGDNCGATPLSLNLEVYLNLADPTQTGTGAWEWQVGLFAAGSSARVFVGSLPYTPGDCVTTTLTFSNNGYHSGGTLVTACGGVGGSATVDFV
jgi:hypothetical protein